MNFCKGVFFFASPEKCLEYEVSDFTPINTYYEHFAT